MRYAFRLAGREHHVVLEEHAEGPRYLVDGDAFQPAVEKLGKGQYKVTVAGESFTFTIDGGHVQEGVHALDLEVRRAKPELVRKGAAGRRGGGQVKPPMPGKIVEVKVQPGDEVTEGEVLVVLEAMKMQNDLKSPISGTVKKVHVQAGANVEQTTVLVEVEPAAEAADGADGAANGDA
ncbi:MAG: biotin/lipoyl-containing protein [Thermoplasmatota archaeon]